MPKHYSEAAALCNYLYKAPVVYVNKVTLEKFKEFLKMKKVQNNPATEANVMQILDKTLFHRDFAKELYEIIADSTILMNKDQVFGGIKQRLSDNYYPFPTKGNYDKFICSFYRDNQNNKVAYEYYLMSALLDKNADAFCVFSNFFG